MQQQQMTGIRGKSYKASCHNLHSPLLTDGRMDELYFLYDYQLKASPFLPQLRAPSVTIE